LSLVRNQNVGAILAICVLGIIKAYTINQLSLMWIIIGSISHQRFVHFNANVYHESILIQTFFINRWRNFRHFHTYLAINLL